MIRNRPDRHVPELEFEQVRAESSRSGVVELGAGRRPKGLVALAVVAALIAVVWVGRSGGGGQAAATTVGHPSTSAAPTTASVTTAPTPPRTMAPSTTAALGQPVRSIVEVGHPLVDASVGLDLFAQTVDGDVLRIDPDTGRIVRTDIPPLGSSGPMLLLSAPNRVLVRPIDFVAGYAVHDDGRTERLAGDLADGLDGLFPGPDDQHLWAMEPYDGNVITADLVNLDGSRAMAPITLTGAESWGSDGRGGVLVQATGGIYLVDRAGAHRVTDGTILAAGPTELLTVECNDRLACLEVVTNRDGGTRTVLGGVPADLVAQRGGVISHDGRYAAFSSYGRTEPELHIVDLRTGADRDVGPTYWMTSLVWSPDDRYVFYVDAESHLSVFDSVSHEARVLLPVLPRVGQFTARLDGPGA